MNYIDGKNGIIVPKYVRPIITYEETILGDKKGARRQFRYGNLHIREYEDYYVVHMDKVDPKRDPVGHLLIDAPEYMAAIVAGLKAAKQAGDSVYTQRRADDNKLVGGIVAACLAGTVAATLSYVISSILKELGGRT